MAGVNYKKEIWDKLAGKAVFARTQEDFDTIAAYDKDSVPINRVGYSLWEKLKEQTILTFCENYIGYDKYSVASYPSAITIEEFLNIVHEKDVVGDVTSNAKGSGARYNSGKPDYSLFILDNFADIIAARSDNELVEVIKSLGEFQQSHDISDINFALCSFSNADLADAAKVFTYGAKKYAAWNWTKGMNWSIPLACAVRHIMAVINGEDVDSESGLSHKGHVICNLMMLQHYHKFYKEGNDLPPVDNFKE